MFDCLKSFYTNLLGKHLDELREGFVSRLMYIDESLYMVDKEGRRLTPPRLYTIMSNTSSEKVYRRPIYGVMYLDRTLGRILRLLSMKQNILSIDLILLRMRDIELRRLGRYADIIQISTSLLDEADLEYVEKYGIEWLDGIDVFVMNGGNIIVASGEEPIDALAAYLYVSRILLGLLGEWVLFNPIRYLGGSDSSSISIVPVDASLAETADFTRLYGYIVECSGSKYLELI